MDTPELRDPRWPQGNSPAAERPPHPPRAPGSRWHSADTGAGHAGQMLQQNPRYLEQGGQAVGDRPSSSTCNFTRHLAGRAAVRAGQREGTVPWTPLGSGRGQSPGHGPRGTARLPASGSPAGAGAAVGVVTLPRARRAAGRLRVTPGTRLLMLLQTEMWPTRSSTHHGRTQTHQPSEQQDRLSVTVLAVEGPSSV